MTGATAPSRVVADDRKDQELVPVPRHNLEEIRVPGKASRAVLVMKTLVQVPDSQIMNAIFSFWFSIGYSIAVNFGRYTRQTKKYLTPIWPMTSKGNNVKRQYIFIGEGSSLHAL